MKITLEDAIKLSKELASMIKEEYTPDVIIGVREGGVLPANEVARFLNKPLRWVKVSRVDSEFEKNSLNEYEKADSEHRKQITKVFDEEWFNSEPEILNSDDFHLKGKKVLVVDDAVHTGKTLDLVIKYLSRFEPLDIKTSALFHVEERKPDYFVGDGEHKYPWSTWARFQEDYPDYRNYLKNIK